MANLIIFICKIHLKKNNKDPLVTKTCRCYRNTAIQTSLKGIQRWKSALTVELVYFSFKFKPYSDEKLYVPVEL